MSFYAGGSTRHDLCPPIGWRLQERERRPYSHDWPMGIKRRPSRWSAIAGLLRALGTILDRCDHLADIPAGSSLSSRQFGGTGIIFSIGDRRHGRLLGCGGCEAGALRAVNHTKDSSRVDDYVARNGISQQRLNRPARDEVQRPF